MARITLLITMLAAVAYISQATPVPENVEDEQLNSKEIQPEFNENIQPNEDILGQDQPESNENHDQIQPKSEESSSQLDDTSEDQFEDSKNKNKNSHDHSKELEKIIEKIKALIEIYNNNESKKKGLERKVEILEQKSRQNSRYTRSTDEIQINDIKVNDISDILKSKILSKYLKLKSMIEEIVNEWQKIPQIISDKLTSQIDENIQKEIKETKLNNYQIKFFNKFLNIINNIINNAGSIIKKVNEVSRTLIDFKKKLILDGIETGIKTGIETGKEFFKDGANLGKSMIETGKKGIEDISKIGDIVQKKFEDSTNIFFPKIKKD